VRCTWTTTTKWGTATTTTPLQSTIDHSHIRKTFVRFCVIYISSSLWSSNFVQQEVTPFEWPILLRLDRWDCCWCSQQQFCTAGSHSIWVAYSFVSR
jgi:hypothetical protein